MALVRGWMIKVVSGWSGVNLCMSRLRKVVASDKRDGKKGQARGSNFPSPRVATSPVPVI